MPPAPLADGRSCSRLPMARRSLHGRCRAGAEEDVVRGVRDAGLLAGLGARGGGGGAAGGVEALDVGYIGEGSLAVVALGVEEEPGDGAHRRGVLAQLVAD